MVNILKYRGCPDYKLNIMAPTRDPMQYFRLASSSCILAYISPKKTFYKIENKMEKTKLLLYKP